VLYLHNLQLQIANGAREKTSTNIGGFHVLTHLSLNTFVASEALAHESGAILEIKLGKRRRRFGVTAGLGGKQSLLGSRRQGLGSSCGNKGGRG